MIKDGDKLEPLIPFEPLSTPSIPSGEPWIAQVKWDGVRMLTYYDGTEVSLFNRKLHERTAQYPELQDIKSYCRANNVILDGELVALENGLPAFHQIMRRDGLRRLDGLAAAMRAVPVTYMVFDILYCNGAWVTDRPLALRQQLLSEMILPKEGVQIVQSFAQTEELYHVIEERGIEGIVCKDLTSAYTVGGKDKRWLKVKNYQDLIATVGGVTLRGKTVNALLLGLYDEKGHFIYIGHAGTGKLTRKDWTQFTDAIAPLLVKDRPFLNIPERSKDALWLKPVFTVKIKYIEWTHHITLRQPSIQAFVATDPKESTFRLAGVSR
ncbi:MAG: DNA ligase [Gorillibacterium sp.]|nr:DNA ligase [Gorillibacterium sp.]